MAKMITPPTHLNTSISRKVLMEMTIAVPTSQVPDWTKEHQEKFLVRLVEKDGPDTWYNFNEKVMRYANDRLAKDEIFSYDIRRYRPRNLQK